MFLLNWIVRISWFFIAGILRVVLLLFIVFAVIEYGESASAVVKDQATEIGTRELKNTFRKAVTLVASVAFDALDETDHVDDAQNNLTHNL